MMMMTVRLYHDGETMMLLSVQIDANGPFQITDVWLWEKMYDI